MIDDKLQEEVINCAHDLQSHMMKGISSHDSFNKLKEKYEEKIIYMAMELLKQAVTNPKSPHKAISDTINRCMNKTRSKKEDLANVDKFYEFCVISYKVFMNDEMGRALPLVFLYNDKSKTLGVAPILNVKEGNSPMDYLKDIVYSANPDAYCMCAEASMNSMKMKGKSKEEIMKEYKYGDLIDDPTSKDIMIVQGNNKTGKKSFIKVFELEGKTGNLLFKEMENAGENFESSKLP